NKKPTLVSQDSLPFGWPLSIKDAQSMSHSSANWPASSPDQRLFGSLTLLEGHSTSVKGVLRCTDPTEQLGQLIISWADEPDICVWSLASRRVVQRLSGHTGRVVACVAHEPAGWPRPAWTRATSTGSCCTACPTRSRCCLGAVRPEFRSCWYWATASWPLAKASTRSA
ncbi:hypothetical protein BOX15_Mlig022991g3, partial [Macrostomum lignano]